MAVLHDTPEEELYELRRLAVKRVDDWQAVIERVDAELNRRDLPIPDASK